MALQSSGAISINDIVTEFGGTAPHSLSEYYAGGGLVPAGAGNVPSSGQIQLDDFYGATAVQPAASGYLYAWGRSKYNMTTLPADTYTPTKIGGNDSSWVFIDSDNNGAAFTKSDGRLWYTGKHFHGPNQDAVHVQYNTLTQHSAGDTDWRQVCLAAQATFGIKNNGRLWYQARTTAFPNGQVWYPNFSEIGGTDWDHIDRMGQDDVATTFVAKKTNSGVYGFGTNGNGQLGLGHLNPVSSVTREGSQSTWDTFQATNYHSVGVRTDGKIWGSGSFPDGSFGPATATSTFVQSAGATQTGWVGSAMTSQNTFAVKSDGRLWGTGWNAAYQLGVGNNSNYTTWVQIGGSYTNWSQDAQDHAFASSGTNWIKTDGKLWGWGNLSGSGSQGSNAINPQQTTYVPRQTVSNATDWIRVGGSWKHRFGIKSNS
jgi:hypothetical protein